MRWTPILRSLEALSGLVQIVGGVVEIVTMFRRPCEHEITLLHNDAAKHKNGSHCPCRPRLVCLNCGMVVSQRTPDEGEELRGAAEQAADAFEDLLYAEDDGTHAEAAKAAWEQLVATLDRENGEGEVDD